MDASARRARAAVYVHFRISGTEALSDRFITREGCRTVCSSIYRVTAVEVESSTPPLLR